MLGMKYKGYKNGRKPPMIKGGIKFSNANFGLSSKKNNPVPKIPMKDEKKKKESEKPPNFFMKKT